MKFLLIIFLLFFLVFRLGGFLLKALAGNSSGQQRNPSGSGQRKYTPKGGNVSVDYEPRKKDRKKGFDGGGEYVDYEEV